MKKGVVEFGIFVLILSIFLSFGVFAVPPSPGTCAIVTPNECVAVDGNYRIMGLSAATNAHAEFPYNGYPYVLCCGFNTTEGTTCTGIPPINKILGLSSLTNAHAEVPSLNNYLTNVCYGDLNCVSSTTGCTSANGIEVVNLSSNTNAHVGTGAGFQTAICCKSLKYLSSCTITAASWNQVDANNGTQVYLTVTGSGLECSGQRLDIEVIGAGNMNATSVSFRADGTALSWWTADWQKATFLGGDKSYSFNATIVGVLTGAGKSMMSSNALTVHQMNVLDHCSTISSCEDYTDSNECNTDSPCKVANAEGISQGYVCDNIKNYCSCSWSAGTCKFVAGDVKTGLCTGGTTLCHDSATEIDYCYPGSCPSTSTPTSNNNNVCDPTDSCASSDCKDGDQASCALGSTCSGGKCSGTPTANINCSYGFTLCQVSGTNYCYPGNTCPSGQIPPSNGNLKCDFGEGCTSTECGDGDQDSCISGTYCSLGKCASIQDPFTVGAVGGCKITQTVEKECNVDPVGYKIISWTGEWTGSGDATGPAYDKCIAGGRASIPCPAEIQLPFFDYYELAIALGVIVLIYISLVLRRKSRKKKK